MSPLRISASLVVALGVAVAACSADSVEGDTNNDAGTTSLPDAAFPPADAGTDATADDAGDAAPPAVCGNGKKEGAETCDDTNTNDGDGCSSTCTIESAFEGDVCPGKTVALTANGQLLTATVSGATTGAFNHYGSACGGGSGFGCQRPWLETRALCAGGLLRRVGDAREESFFCKNSLLVSGNAMAGGGFAAQ